MYSKRIREKKMRDALEKNILKDHPGHAVEKIDGNMYDCPIVDPRDPFKDAEKHTGSIIQQSQTDEGDSDMRYIVIEKTEDDVSHGKKDGISFYNPIQNSQNFQRAFYESGGPLGSAMPFHFQEKNLVAGSARPAGCKVHSNKFPGTLHLALDSVKGYIEKANNTTGISIRLDINGSISESAAYPIGKNIPLDFYIRVPVSANDPVRIRAVLVSHRAASLLFSGSAVPVAECQFQLENIDPLQNRLIEMSGQWVATRSSNVLKNFRRLFFSPDVPAGALRLYASYIADDEVHTINAAAPSSLFTLNKWLTIHQHARNLLFAGYLSVRHLTNLELDGENGRQMRRIGDDKKMYVKWYGFTIFLFDAFTKKLSGSINIADAELSCDGLPQGMISFKTREGVAQVYCDTAEKLAGCVEAMSLLFPQVTALK